MSNEMSRCKITVLKRMLNQDLIDEYLDFEGEHSACGIFSEGQEIIVEHPFKMPAGFCSWAWADLRRDLMMISTGGNMPGRKHPGTTLSGCTDWFRPVIFKIERIE